MIIVKLMGGLGNQMFQIAFAKKLAIENNEEIVIDSSVYSKYKIRNFSLNNLIISDSINSIEEIDLTQIELKYLRLTQKIYHIVQKIVKVLGLRSYLGEMIYKSLSRKGLYYNFTPYYYNHAKNSKKLKCLYGYFQSERYFSDIKQQVSELLRVNKKPNVEEKIVLNELNSCNAVGVSIRIGDDYIKSSSWNVCTEEYYYKGMEYIYNKQPDVEFFIFSDDTQKVKNQYKFNYPVKYIEGFKDYESLRMLYTCKHFVISNSSFSWWGAFLSNSEHKIIIAPERWNNNFEKKPDIYTDNMLLIRP